MRRKFTVYGLRFSKTSFWNRMNTAFLDPAVATVLTVCGIETRVRFFECPDVLPVATVLTVCGIETDKKVRISNKKYEVATVLTVCGIETFR